MRKSTYNSIGNAGTEEKLLEAFRKVAMPSDCFWYEAGFRKKNALIDGAVLAFHSGHPKNVQALLSTPSIFKTGEKGSDYSIFVAKVLYKISERTKNPDDIKLALARVPEENRGGILGHALYITLNRDTDNAPFINLLLQAGADPNVEMYGRVGHPLLYAVLCSYPEAIIKSLHDRGARFEDALSIALTDEYYQKYAAALTHYQEKFGEKPAAADQTEMEQLHDKVVELDDKVARLTAALQAAGIVLPEDKEPQREIDPDRYARLGIRSAKSTI